MLLLVNAAVCLLLLFVVAVLSSLRFCVCLLQGALATSNMKSYKVFISTEVAAITEFARHALPEHSQQPVYCMMLVPHV